MPSNNFHKLHTIISYYIDLILYSSLLKVAVKFFLVAIFYLIMYCLQIIELDVISLVYCHLLFNIGQLLLVGV